MKKNILLILIIAMLIVTVGCNEVKENQEPKDIQEESEKISEEELNFDQDYLVNSDWLNENLDNSSLLILDARGEKAYNNGHIPGAISTSWQSLSKMDGSPGDIDWGVVKNNENLSKSLSEIGVDNDKRIVVYTDTLNGWGEDGRIFWTLRMVGIDNVRILDGGINLWKDSELDISKESVKPEETDYKINKINKLTSIDMTNLKENYSDYLIIDSRELEEYNGAKKYGEARGGHLPGSIYLNFRSVLNEDGTFKSKEELEKLFEGALIDKEDKIVTYCTAGIRSAHLQIALEMAGYENVMNYDASFYEWAGNDECSVEK